MKLNRITIERVIIIKGTVMIGLIAYYVVPPDYQFLVGLSANLTWLWKT